MGTTLTGTTPQDTYDSLIKVTDNGPLSGTAKYLSDGLGNDSVLAVSTSRIGIGSTIDSGELITAYGATEAAIVFQNTNSGTGASQGLYLGTLNAENFLWTYEDQPLIFGANNAERMRITAAGNVGIGTSAPNIGGYVAGNTVLTMAPSGSDRFSILQLSGNRGFGGNQNGNIDFVNSEGTATITSRISAQNAANALDGEIAFETRTSAGSLTERVRITSTGVLSLTQGQIKFPTTQVASADVNTLDDYEEGTWTMGVSFGGASVGVTYSDQQATYTKIGRQVTVNGYTALSNKGSSTGNAFITGLPFTIANSGGNYSSASFWFQNLTYTGQLISNGPINTTTVSLQDVTEAGVNGTITDANFTNTTGIVISFTYFV